MSLGPIFDAALNAQVVCEELGLKFCVIGGVALQRCGEARFIADADFSVLAKPGREEIVASALLGQLQPRVENPLDFARRTRVLLVQSIDGVGIDIADLD